MEDASAPEDLLRCLRSMKRARRGTRLPTTRNSERLSLTSSRKGVLEVNPQKIARVTGVLFLITFITAIPAYFFYVPVLDDPRYILGGGGGETSVAFGAFLELILIIAN